MSEAKHTPSAGALRAATIYLDLLRKNAGFDGGLPHCLAEIIDLETHAGELLEALEAICEAMPPTPKLPLVIEIKEIAEAAIRKTKGEL